MAKNSLLLQSPPRPSQSHHDTDTLIIMNHFFEHIAFSKLRPPSWAVDEAQRRIVLLLNHVLMQEPQATERLERQKDRVIALQWRTYCFKLLITPAGLFDLAAPDAIPELVLTLVDGSLLALAQSVVRGEKPTVRVEGDVQLASDVNWLTEHVRWNAEDDLARILGDVPAHALTLVARTLSQGLRSFLAQARAVVTRTSTP